MSKFKSASDIQKMANQSRQQLVKTEYTNYDEYLAAQKQMNDHYFAKPPENCELCGFPMDYNKHVLTEWEEKWSVHEYCRDKMAGMLDRETGIARERRELERRANRNRHR
jgi:hypothetical protein